MVSWLVFKVITQRSSYVIRFYFIVIIRINDNVADSIDQMIMTGSFFFHLGQLRSLVGMFGKTTIAGLINFFST